MFIENLSTIGLSPNESIIYEELLKNKSATISLLAQKTNLKRSNLYNILQDLKQKKLVEEIKNSKIIKFTARHPTILNDLIDKKTEELDELKTNIHSLTEIYNLTHHRPGVRVYVGKEGIKKALENTLTASFI